MKTLIKMISYNTYFERLSRLLPLLHIRRYGTVNTKLCMVWNSTPPTPEKTTLTCKTLQQKSQKEMLCSNLKSLPQNVKPWASNLGVFWRRFEFQHQKQQKKGRKKIHLLSSQEYCQYTSLPLALSLSSSLSLPLSLYQRNKAFFHHSQAWLLQSSFFWSTKRSPSVFLMCPLKYVQNAFKKGGCENIFLQQR